jgi:hypothetical protein
MKKKKIKFIVRWFDGFIRVYHPIDFEFGNSYLWLKFEGKEKEKWIPLIQVRHIDTEMEE